MPMCNDGRIIYQGASLARRALKAYWIAVIIPNALHLLFIASLLFILQGACTNSEIVNSITPIGINGLEGQYKIPTNFSDNALSENNLIDSIENASASNLYYGEIAPASLDVSVTASKSTVCPGGEFTYTIQICNFGSSAATNITIDDVLNQSLELISVSIEPGEDGLWHISDLGPGECFTIMLTVSVPNYDTKFNGISRISGHGYANIHDDYSTTSQIDNMYDLRNCVYVFADGVSDLSACTVVFVEDIAGTTLKERDHGSGSYNCDNIVGITRPEKGSIQYNTSLHAKYSPISLTLPQSRALPYNSRWTDELRTNVHFTEGSMAESYRHADNVKKNSSVQLSWNASSLKTDSQFSGQGHLGYVDQLSSFELDPAMNIDDERIKPAFEAREDYAGDFKIKAAIDTCDFGASSNKSVSGTGLVSNDKRLGNSQRTYEYGTGSYQGEESVKTFENYIAKDINATFLPVSYSYRPGRPINVSMKWGEGSWSQIKGVSFIGEEVSSADYLNKKSILQWQGDLESEGNYSGRGQFKAVLKDENGKSDRVRVEQEYIGNYSVWRKIHLLELFGTDRPHIYVRNDGRLVKDLTKNITMAKYSIVIINNGNTDLGPINVRDVFPVGTQFISSSVTPSRISSDYVNWTFTSLPIGQSLKIELNLNPTKETNELVNRVSVSGWHSHRFVTTGNFSTIENCSLDCDKLNITTYKIAMSDPINPSIIAYRIAVENQDYRSIVAKVTDFIPYGLMFINSSIEPENLTYNLSWIIMDVAPGETKYVDYIAQATSSGMVVNRAHTDAYAVDGSGRASSEANVDTNLTGAIFSEYSSEYSYSSDWKPPEWEFNYSDSLFNDSSESTCGAGGACPLNTYKEDEGFKNIYGMDDRSKDIYGGDVGSENTW